MNKVPLYSAYYWSCPDCLMDNFAYGEKVYLTEEEEAELRFEKNIPEELIEGEFVYIPKKVKCRSCKKTFETEEGNDNE